MGCKKSKNTFSATLGIGFFSTAYTKIDKHFFHNFRSGKLNFQDRIKVDTDSESQKDSNMCPHSKKIVKK